MSSHIAIYDIGKTHKKLLVFDEQYEVVYQKEEQLPEIQDEDGFVCEDIHLLSSWIKDSWVQLLREDPFIKAVNVSAYGASWVHLDAEGEVVAPLYSYFKPFSETLRQQFLQAHGPEEELMLSSASPWLGSLNAGLQLYRLKYEKPLQFQKIRHSLYLPQYLASLIHGEMHTEITSVGCHSLSWDFAKGDYQAWVYAEGLDALFPPIADSSLSLERNFGADNIACGIGLHDSSAALAPFLGKLSVPFVMLSTGTWSISLHPFNTHPLSRRELSNDCLAYLSVNGRPVKASRLLLGEEHAYQVKRLADFFGVDEKAYQEVLPDPDQIHRFSTMKGNVFSPRKIAQVAELEALKQDSEPDLVQFSDFSSAYHRLIWDLVDWQLISLDQVMHNSPVEMLLVSGGFCQNQLFMQMLAQRLSPLKVYEASIQRASALGAAMMIYPQAQPRALDWAMEIRPIAPFEQ